MTARVYLDGTPVSHYRGSLSWDEALRGRTAMNADLYDPDGTLETPRGLYVEVREQDTGDVLWAGHTVESSRVRIGTSSAFRVTVECQDLSGLADRRVEAEGWLDTSAGQIVRDVINEYLAAEGVTAGQIDTGPHVQDARVNYRPLGEFLDDLADTTNAAWRIDQGRQLQWYDLAKLDRSAPADLTLDVVERESIKIDRSNPEYRNQQVIRGIKARTDERTVELPGQNQPDGSGSRAYTVRFPIAEEPEVYVDREGDGTYVQESVGIRGIEEGAAAWYWSKGDPYVTRADDSTPVDPSGRVRIVYVGMFDALVRVADQVEVDRLQATGAGASGVIDAVQERTDLESIDAGFERAGKLLVRWGGEDDYRVKLNTREAGYRAGQVCQVDVPGFTGEVRLESVEAIERGSGGITYKITAVQGPVRGKWTTLWRDSLLPPPSLVDQVGTDEIAALLDTQTDTTAWGGTTSASVEPCAIFDGDGIPMPFTLC